MNGGPRGSEPEILVVTEDQLFGRSVVEAVERAGVAASAERVNPAAGGPARRDIDEFDGAIINAQIAEPAAVVDRILSEDDTLADIDIT